MSRWNRKVSESKGFEVPEEGAHYAACVALVGLGTHEDEYKGEVSKNEKIYLAWELLGDPDSKGEPFVVAKEFNFFVSPTSNLGKFLGSWRGKPLGPGEEVDVLKVLGRKCQLTIAHKKSTKNGKERVNVDVMAAAPLVKGATAPDPVHEPFFWDPEQGPLSEPEWLPRSYGKTLTAIYAESLEARGASPASRPGAVPAGASTAAGPFPDPGDAGDDDDIPF